ncbi:MAG: hypothetical protein A4E30_01498 [Methanomassiliicoccales archaeon PtaB.Bin215]|nr:MAG: hypothetical protein A4E30_01498 [Methanomassiliicoccales archaeon PtaB.Bin215]
MIVVLGRPLDHAAEITVLVGDAPDDVEEQRSAGHEVEAFGPGGLGHRLSQVGVLGEKGGQEIGLQHLAGVVKGRAGHQGLLAGDAPTDHALAHPDEVAEQGVAVGHAFDVLGAVIDALGDPGVAGGVIKTVGGDQQRPFQAMRLEGLVDPVVADGGKQLQFLPGTYVRHVLRVDRGGPGPFHLLIQDIKVQALEIRRALG